MSIDIDKTSLIENRIIRNGARFHFELYVPDKSRINFTVARTIGHLFLHMGYALDEDKWYSLREYEWSATECGSSDRFALAFLMPKGLFILKVNEYARKGRVNSKKVAEYFNVDSIDVYNRCMQLGCIERLFK